MAAEAAARMGAGLVSAATHSAHIPAFLARRPEIMARGAEDEDSLRTLLEQASVVVIGPGLGRSDWSRLALRLALDAGHDRALPLLLDADALNLVAAGETAPLPPRIVLTPHPGEAARLLATTTSHVQADRLAAALELQARYGGVCVLKGAGTLICHAGVDGRRLERCDQGNPGMATGGMGDVLSGIIGALLAQHLGLADAARLGVCLHAAAADEAARDGERGMLACDLLPWLRQLANPA